MSKYVEKVDKLLSAALEKLKNDYHEADYSYRDSGYDRYFNKMEKIQKEIDEIESYSFSSNESTDKSYSMSISVNEYKEYLEWKGDLKSIQSKLYYISQEYMSADLASLISLIEKYV